MGVLIPFLGLEESLPSDGYYCTPSPMFDEIECCW